MTGKRPVGVLVMAYGGPGSLEEIPGYLADIRHGRATPRAVVDEITENYRAIGGRSPLLEVTRRQVDALHGQLGDRFRCYIGMRHWSPWIEEVVGEMVDDGVEKAVGVVLAPQFSGMSVTSYHDEGWLISAFASRVRQGLERWPEEQRVDVHVVFSAHSLPVRVISSGDPYADQCLETATLVAHAAELPDERWSWSWQSAGRTPEPWAGPDLVDHLEALAARGIENVLCVPVGFVSDHVELLYDVDRRARAAAEKLGMTLERPPALNDDPVFIEGLAGTIRDVAER